jgi:alkanesulfonate monooxygenase SsuD/methylene tetrahydromethanopterin reductase-like flavin-dependent oxidoreductase (luciferase family)
VAAAAGCPEAEIDALQGREWGMRVVHVAPTREEALRAVEAPFMGYQRKMAVLRSDGTGGTVPNSFDRRALRLRPFQEYLATGWTLLGTPDEVREGLGQYLEATGYQRVLLLMALPGLPTELALRSMRMFAEHVAPAMTPVAHL